MGKIIAKINLFGSTKLFEVCLATKGRHYSFFRHFYRVRNRFKESKELCLFELIYTSRFIEQVIAEATKQTKTHKVTPVWSFG